MDSLNKTLLFITGTRADYGKLQPLAEAAKKQGFKIAFFITGMHMMKQYGETKLEVKRFDGADFFEFVNQKAGDPLDLTLTKTINGFSDFIHEHKPDLVIIHGDRIEALATSIVCALHYIPSAHIEGGEISGTIDESIRHCNTKLCSVHFVSSEKARQRVIRLGEAANTVFNIGSPELDTHATLQPININDVKKRYGIKFEDYGIVIFHPVVSEVETIYEQAKSLYSILVKSNKNFIIIMPNNDPGTNKLMDVIAGLPKKQFHLIPSMRFNYFSVLMKNCSGLIGNSSAGVREAPFLGIASLDIGTRQTNRTANDSESITRCTAFDKKTISEFINSKWGIRYESCLEFGDGNAATRFIGLISKKSFWKHSKQKNFYE